MKRIPLRGNNPNRLVALVDDEDYIKVKDIKWYLTLGGRAKDHPYASSSFRIEKGVFKSVFMHRYLLNPDKGMVVDHINDDGLDNRRFNIRIVTRSLNTVRSRKRVKKSKYWGVGFNSRKGKWYASISFMGKTHFKGFFEAEEEAFAAYRKLRENYYGSFFRNFLPTLTKYYEIKRISR